MVAGPERRRCGARLRNAARRGHLNETPLVIALIALFLAVLPAGIRWAASHTDSDLLALVLGGAGSVAAVAAGLMALAAAGSLVIFTWQRIDRHRAVTGTVTLVEEREVAMRLDKPARVGEQLTVNRGPKADEYVVTVRITACDGLEARGEILRDTFNGLGRPLSAGDRVTNLKW